MRQVSPCYQRPVQHSHTSSHTCVIDNPSGTSTSRPSPLGAWHGKSGASTRCQPVHLCPPPSPSPPMQNFTSPPTLVLLPRPLPGTSTSRLSPLGAWHGKWRTSTRCRLSAHGSDPSVLASSWRGMTRAAHTCTTPAPPATTTSTRPWASALARRCVRHCCVGASVECTCGPGGTSADA